jgi:hypothetical protein
MKTSELQLQLKNIKSILADHEMVKSLDSTLILHLVEKRDAIKIQLNSKL